MKFSVIRWICVSILITWCVSAAPIALISPPNTLDSSLSRGEQHHPPFQRQQYPFHVDDQLLIHIMTNIKTQIHTNILAKISGSICEKIRAKLSVEAKILGGIIKMDSTKVNAIQTAAINGLQGIYRHKIDSEILNELEVHVFQRMEDRFRAAYADKTLASESDLAKLLIDLETDVVSQVKVALPKIEAKLEVFVDTELKTHIKEIEVEIPLLMSIKIGVDIDVSVTVKASLQLAIQACARANVRILAKALLHGFR